MRRRRRVRFVVGAGFGVGWRHDRARHPARSSWLDPLPRQAARADRGHADDPARLARARGARSALARRDRRHRRRAHRRRVPRGFGARGRADAPDHPTGTDRIAEVAAQLDDDVVVNVQGDEPLIEGFVIDAAVAALAERSRGADGDARAPRRAGRARRSEPREGRARPRAAARSTSRAARSRSGATGAPPPLWQHVGLYAYRREFLLRFVALAADARRARRGARAAARARARLPDPLRGDRGLASARWTCPPTSRAVEAALSAHRERRRAARATARRAHGARMGPALFELGPLGPGRRARHAELHHARARARRRALPAAGGLSCALPFDQNGPQSGVGGRHNPIHYMLADGGDALAGAQDAFAGGFHYADDAVDDAAPVRHAVGLRSRTSSTTARSTTTATAGS